ncbi:hypothetical protein DICVIV_08807 [Dictyocaulus viviparus]|uniref:Uncharacterized protein n=1 Tax=Dictyocaulus viviparus TaxID=29172 RepID=A0A0D8XRX4_DICVI|nr:hypothetical protein DICVIV_08807 [Dictyocaulus viviparus]
MEIILGQIHLRNKILFKSYSAELLRWSNYPCSKIFYITNNVQLLLNIPFTSPSLFKGGMAEDYSLFLIIDTSDCISHLKSAVSYLTATFLSVDQPTSPRSFKYNKFLTIFFKPNFDDTSDSDVVISESIRLKILWIEAKA